MSVADYPWFPMYIDLSAKRVVVVGAGRIAARRVGVLADFCPNIAVVAPAIHPQIEALARDGRAQTRQRPFRDSDLEGADLVLACTDDGALNGRIAVECRARGIPVNVASDRTMCDFLFPGVARKGDLVIGVTAGGRDHALAKQTTQAAREYLERE